MLFRIVLAIDSPKLQNRLRKLVDQADSVVSVVPAGETLWETISNDTYDLIFISRSLLGASASETVNFLRTLPESPDLVVFD